MHSRSALAFVGVLALVSAACDQAEQSLGPVDLTRPSSAVVQNDIIQDFAEDFVNNCTTPAQTGTVTGNLHTQVIVTTNGNHGNFKISAKLNASGESTDGTKYQGRINVTEHQTVDIADGVPAVATERFIVQLTSNGSGGNLAIESSLHLTVNANGEVTAFKLDPFAGTCSG